MAEFGSLVINPTLRLSNSGLSEGMPAWRVHYFTPKNAQCSVTISPSLARVLLNLRHNPTPETYLEGDALRYLIAQDILVPKTKEPLYQCPVPISSSSREMDGWHLNPNFTLYSDAKRGTQLREHGPWSGTVAEYHLTPELADAAWDFAHGDCTNVNALNSLHEIGYLDTKEAFEKKDRSQREQFLHWQKTFHDTKKTMIGNLVSQVELANLQDYSAHVQRRGFLDGDFGIAGKQRSHVFDDPQLTWLLDRGALLASKISNTPLVSSYSFLAFYHSGGVLPPHRDKSHCNISMSLAINVPEDVSGTWPLEVQDPHGNSSKLYWGTGNTLLFDGRHYQHGRPPMPPSNNAVYLILHFKIHPEYI